MKVANNNREIVDRFRVVASQFCSAVDSAPSMDRAELLLEIYRILPTLIHEAVGLPKVESDDNPPPSNARLSHQQWDKLYNALKKILGDWDLYRQVFDPVKDQGAILGTLADDLADIYCDLKEGLVLMETQQATPGHIIWKWRFSFYSHWGKHAIDALGTIHHRISELVV